MERASRITHRRGGRSATERALELVGRQFGVIARRQLLALGISGRRIDGWIGRGLLHVRYPGVYAWGRPDLSEAGELGAALLYGGSGSALAGLTALWWRGLLEHRPQVIHIDAPGRGCSRADLRIRHPGAVRRQWHRGLPVGPLPRALLLAAATLEPNSLRLVLARAEYQRQLSLPSLQEALGPGRAGSRALRAAMDAHLPQLAACASELERSFLLLCERHSVPLPEPNSRIGRFRPDMLWRSRRLVVELDGRRAHGTEAQRQADAARQRHLESLDYRVVRFSWAEVTDEPARVASAVRSALRAAA